MDLRLRLLADDTGDPADLVNSAIGVMFGFVDNGNYYRVVEYNAAIAERVKNPANGFVGYTPPDFHSCFSNPLNGPDPLTVNDLMADDDIHPNGEGYRSMAVLWCRELRGQLGMPFDMVGPLS